MESTMVDKATLITLPEAQQREKVNWVFGLYGSTGTIDGADVIDAIRALNLNPTIAFVCSLGGSTTRGETSMTLEEFWKVYCAVRDDTNEGGFVDFIECLKIYDVGENGLMKFVDLSHMLLNLGEPVTQDELDGVLTDCLLEEEDDDGWIPYLPFLCRLCEKPVPKSIKPE
ncbi:myosin light chain alkali-like [Macrosteles quadrilineatus]|uniref:myosin light chain alkali-like n=1 Tax=Macrosteles quadrilineatus TaxID=74068 RepID=UPI0023E2A83B|nr:myosin light chain alkali-like [Macrosteles quadrilineatus]